MGKKKITDFLSVRSTRTSKKVKSVRELYAMQPKLPPLRHSFQRPLREAPRVTLTELHASMDNLEAQVERVERGIKDLLVKAQNCGLAKMRSDLQ